MHPLAEILANSVNSGKFAEAVSLEAANMTGKMLYYTRGEMPTEDQEEIVQGNNRHISKRYPILQPSGGFTQGYRADKDGKLAFGVTIQDGVEKLHRLVGDHWEVCPMDLDEMEFFGAGDKPGEAIMLTARKDDKPRSLVRVDAATGAVGDALIQDAGYDFNGYLFRDPSSHVIVGAVYDQGGPKMVWFNEAYRGLQKAVDSLFPGKVVRILGLSDSGKIALISTASDKQPPIYSWVDLEKRGAGLIKNSRPWIDPARMQAVNVMKFKTRDGKKVDALVTLPPGASKDHPVPLVVIPPEWQSEHLAWGFDEKAQYFASRGYAVLRPNHRGSRGYRWMFPTADEWDYQKMYQDVADATKTVLRTGMIDPRKVAILGSNFGGFLSLANAAYEPDLYRCAIALSPTCDWANLLQEMKFFANDSGGYGLLIRKLGDPKKEAARFDALSPLRHADAIRAAVFIGNGEWDQSYEIANAKDLVNAVRKRGLNAEQVTFSGERSGLSHLEQKLDFYGRIETFLAQSLGGGK
jgi:dipeptidyl aminopeptidase/acylaminoacyl peptidase